jgi:hypothetical protein
LEVLIPGIFPIRSDAIAQNEWVVQLAFAQPRVLFAVLAIGSAELRARRRQLGHHSVEPSYKERDLSCQVEPDFVDYKMKAIQLISRTMTIIGEALEVSTIYAIMCLLAIEVWWTPPI